MHQQLSLFDGNKTIASFTGSCCHGCLQVSTTCNNIIITLASLCLFFCHLSSVNDSPSLPITPVCHAVHIAPSWLIAPHTQDGSISSELFCHTLPFLISYQPCSCLLLPPSESPACQHWFYVDCCVSFVVPCLAVLM